MSTVSPEENLKKYMSKLYSCVFSYQTANSLILPIVPYLATSMNATNTQYSLSFTVYYIAQLIGSFTFGKIGDRYGRKLTLFISLLGLTIFTFCQIFTTNPNIFILFRFLAGLFDAQTPVFQACMGDMTSSHQRAHYLSQLEAVNNVAQTIGPFIGGILSSIQLKVAMWCAFGLYCISFLLAIFIVPESLPILLERQKILENLKSQNLPKEIYEEEKKRLLYQLSLQEQAVNQTTSNSKKKKWKFNYVMGIAIVGEFCCRWIINVFDVSVAQYAGDVHNMSSFEFSLTSAIGSIINIIQTGWLFNKFLAWDISIPIITSLAGISGAIGIVICVLSKSKLADFIASLFLIAAYGFAAPTAPTVMSTESSPSTQGVAVSLVLIGGQSAYITAPSVLSSLYSFSVSLPFLISLIPCALVFLTMIILHFIPGGKTAGQVPLEFALENYMKDSKMAGVDNEHELEELAKSGDSKKEYPSSSDKKGYDNEIMIEMINLERTKKSKENDESIFLEHENVVDEDAFIVPPRFDSFSRSSTRSLISTISEIEKEPDHSIPLQESKEEEEEHSSGEEDIAI